MTCSNRHRRVRLVVDDEVLRLARLPMRHIFRIGQPPLEILEARLAKLAPPVLTDEEPEEPVSIGADLAIHAHFQEEDRVRRVSSDPPFLLRLAIIRTIIRVVMALVVACAPPSTLSERFVLRVWHELVWSLREVDHIAPLPRKLPARRAHHPLQISADIVREALAVQSQDAFPVRRQFST